MDLGSSKIEPIWFMFAWQRLGDDAKLEQRKYLNELLTSRPEDLNYFLKQMFRAEFIDDYTALKPLIDYGELSKRIDQHERFLNPEKVKQFRTRFHAEAQDNRAGAH
jgi:hypothetical protein